VAKYVNSVSKAGMTTGATTGRHTDRHVWTPFKSGARTETVEITWCTVKPEIDWKNAMQIKRWM